MKVLITTDWYKPAINGVVTSVCNLREELQQRGHEVKILTLSRTAHSYEEEGVIYMGSVNAGYIYPGARLRVSPGRELYRGIIEWNPDIVHSQCEFSTFFMAKKIAEECKIPLVHTYHTVYEDYTHYFSPYKKWGRDMVQFLTRQISEKVDSMIAPSTKIETLLKDYGIHCPVSVIPSGIDLSKYDAQTRTDSRERIRGKYKMDRKTTVLLYVGRLAKEKNVEELLEYQQKVQESGWVFVPGWENFFFGELHVRCKKNRPILQKCHTERAKCHPIRWRGGRARGRIDVSKGNSPAEIARLLRRKNHGIAGSKEYSQGVCDAVRGQSGAGADGCVLHGG